MATLTLLAGAAAAQDSLSPDQMRVLAGRAAAAGEAQLAREAAQALLARDPGDTQALLALSRAERDMQDFDAARDAARAAWREAGTEDERYAAALAMAQAHSSAGARTRSQLWLRRAMQVAPGEAQRAQAERDFRYVRMRNPWSTRLTFALTPSSNVNGGTTSDRFDLFIDQGSNFYYYFPDSVPRNATRALSGLEILTGVSTSLRLGQSETTRSFLDFGLTHRTYALSPDARDIAPDVEGSDFARTTLSAGLRHDMTTASKRLGLSFGANVQHDWYAGEDLSRTWTLSTSARYALTPKLMAQVGLSGDHEEGFDARSDVNGWRASLGAVRVLEGGHRLSLAVAHRETDSDAGTLDYTEREAKVALNFGRPVFGTDLSLGLSAAEREHDEHLYSLDGRRDHRFGAWATVTFDRFDYYGFVPDVTFKTNRTESDLGLYDSEEFGVSVGIRSKF
ncbi:surface lipoprotein assembly modifier [Roseivivax sediminis]|uniref:surface lipoprotein assembly modifier n=1 Tax=Roseivivax sediminis TaxID=936889 RepID=UPI00122D0D75|nr:surface lipoprotein assembly modifier [Roseivivax sediminis]